MTLVTPIAIERALVVAADKRGRDPKRGAVDDLTKLVQLGRYGLAAATGSPRFLAPDTYAPQFDLYELMGRFFDGREITPLSLNEFGAFVMERFRHYRVTYKKKHFDVPPSRMLFQAIIFSWSEIGTDRHLLEFKLAQDNELSMVPASWRCDHSGLQGFGDIEVVKEIIAGSNPLLDDVRLRADVQLFLGKQRPKIGTVSVEQALAFCPWIIRTCAERHESLTGKPSPISPAVDMVVIDVSGFRWMLRAGHPDEGSSLPAGDELTSEEHAEARRQAYFLAMDRGGGKLPPYDPKKMHEDFSKAAGLVKAMRTSPRKESP